MDNKLSVARVLVEYFGHLDDGCYVANHRLRKAQQPAGLAQGIDAVVDLVGKARLTIDNNKVLDLSSTRQEPLNDTTYLQRWREEGKTGQHPSLHLPDLDTYPPIWRWGCQELATYPLLAQQLQREFGGKRKYSLTKIGKSLVTDAEGLSYAPYVLQHHQDALMSAWPLVHEAVLDPTIEPFAKVHGEPAYSYYGKKPKMNGLMRKAMSRVFVPFMTSVLDGYDGFKGVKRLVDVGGSAGDCLRIILQKHCFICEGINFDLPEVVAKAPSIPEVTHIGGDMFKSIHVVDAIFMKWVLTTWTDDECKLIMENYYKALLAGRKLIACEPVLPDDSNESQRTRALLEGDIFVMTIYRAKEIKYGWKALKYLRLVSMTVVVACLKMRYFSRNRDKGGGFVHASIQTISVSIGGGQWVYSDYGDRKENLKDGIWSMAFSDCDSGGNHQKATKKMSATIDNSYCDGLRFKAWLEKDYSVEEEITNLLETPKVVTATLEDRVIEKGQSSEPSLKDKEPVEEEASKETLENVKEKVSKLQATIDLQDPIKNEASSIVKKNHSSDLILGNLDEQMVKKKRSKNQVEFRSWSSKMQIGSSRVLEKQNADRVLEQQQNADRADRVLEQQNSDLVRVLEQQNENRWHLALGCKSMATDAQQQTG
ncbi:methyltransferase 2 domain-containing protein [Citrus sinensis]|uniref:Methyltransferase 2 domain-containing protein n=1 Tax=Citrus sinensis TaxID=2711 RepID=A0ACB8M4A7_CITSI|nr:methyltransferase 2 domain-containing protein [Citrus sinensis]